MNTPIRKNVTLTTNADDIIQAVSAITGKSQGDIISEAIMTPKLQVIANFQTRQKHPVAYMIDMYRQDESKMTMTKSMTLLKYVHSFLLNCHVDTEKMTNFAEYFLECLIGLNGIANTQPPLEFQTIVCSLDICVTNNSNENNDLVYISDGFDINLVTAMKTHIANRRIYSNSKLFHILVIILNECLTTPREYMNKINTGKDAAHKITFQEASCRICPDWDEEFDDAIETIETIFA